MCTCITPWSRRGDLNKWTYKTDCVPRVRLPIFICSLQLIWLSSSSLTLPPCLHTAVFEDFFFPWVSVVCCSRCDTDCRSVGQILQILYCHFCTFLSHLCFTTSTCWNGCQVLHALPSSDCLLRVCGWRGTCKGFLEFGCTVKMMQGVLWWDHHKADVLRGLFFFFVFLMIEVSGRNERL